MRRALATLVLAAALLLAVAPAAWADAFTVDSLGDAPDDTLDNTCDSDAGVPVVCTLRAAIQEANFTGSLADTIGFDSSIATSGNPGCLSSDDAACRIDITTDLPSTSNVTINGCSSDLNAAHPCVGVNGGGTTLRAIGGGVEFRGLAVTGLGSN